MKTIRVWGVGLAWAALAGAAPVTLTVDPGKVLHRIEAPVYGHFLEHIYHSCNGGLWGELIWNRSFEDVPGGHRWRVRDGVVEQTSDDTDVRLTFGDASWGDYEFTLEAQKTGGAEGFLVLVRAAGDREWFWLNLGGWQNQRHGLERHRTSDARQTTVMTLGDGSIESGRWYRIRIRCEGRQIQAWLDDQRIMDYLDDGSGPLKGRPGIGTWSTQAKFRNLKVATLDGRTLFQGLPSTAGSPRYWSPYGPASFGMDDQEPFNSTRCARIRSHGSGGAGLEQKPFNLRKGETLRGSVWARGPVPRDLVVRLLDGARVLAEKKFAGVSGDWKELPFEFQPSDDSTNAAFQVGLAGEGEMFLDQISLMPAAWAQAGGFRPDLLKAIAELRPPVIRWPGGCYASPYRWKNGIGPQTKRVIHPRAMWDDVDVNSLGTDEFIDLCRRVGSEPLIVINAGTTNWNRGVLDNDFLKEALEWIEYCNGPADSTWGKVRAAHGHPEPYKVKYWEIDNETWHMRAEAYADLVKRFAPAMRRADPSIQLLMCGSGGLGQGGNGLAWNRVLVEQCADLVEYLSIHHYENPDRFRDGPGHFERFIRDTQEQIRASKNPKLQLFVSEWNAQSTDWRTGLYAGGLLNAFERCGDVVGMAAPALFLRHVSARDWDNAFINFDHRTWFPAPNYVVMKLWRDHHQPLRVAAEGDTGPLNVTAAASEDKRTVVFKAVNPTDAPVDVELKVSGFSAPKAEFDVVAPGGLNVRNDLDAAERVRAEGWEVKTGGGACRFTLPPLSAGLVEIRQ